MFKYIATLILAFGALKANSQVVTDSLWNIWQQENLEDTTRLEALSAICDQPSVITEVDSLSKYSNILYREAIAMNSPKHIGMAYLYRARTASIRYDFELAIGRLDSAIWVFEKIEDNYNHSRALSNKGGILSGQGKIVEALKVSTKSLELMKLTGNIYGLAGVSTSVSMIYGSAGLTQKQIYHANRGLDYAKQTGNLDMIAQGMHSMAHMYVNIENHEMAREYHLKTLEMMEEIGSESSIIFMKEHIASEDLKTGEYQLAKEQFEKLVAVYQKRKDEALTAFTQLKLASSLIGLKDYEHAQVQIVKAREVMKKNNNSEMSFQFEVLLNKVEGDFYLQTKNFGQAAKSCKEWLQSATIAGQILGQRDACYCLYSAYKGLGDGNNALKYNEQYMALNDTLDYQEGVKKSQQLDFARQLMADSLAQVEKDRIVEAEHNAEVAKKNKTRNILVVSGLIVLLIAGGLFSRNRYIRKAKNVIEEERDRSDNLLLNILPEEIAKELKEKGKADARDFDMVSMLFTDFKQFTQASEKISAQVLVGEINACFEAFDAIMEKYGIEKIKTIGDAYMAAGGLPIPSDDSVKNTILAGLEMQEFIVKRKKERDEKGLPAFEMRVGIHTGPVVAGIVGVKKFQYDIWGDTVNTANRMESYSADGQVNISKATYDLVKEEPEFEFESRGKIEVKGKGEMEMWFVSVKS